MNQVNLKACDVLLHRLTSHIRGLLIASTISIRPETQPNCQKLAPTEEKTIIRYILDLYTRGFAPQLCEVADMADKVLGVRGGQPVGKRWAKRFVTRLDKLKIAFN